MSLLDGNAIAQIERNSLRDQTVKILRDQILSGRIKPGTKITERDVAEILGISRMPAREALLDLERHGLVISRSSGRYVIELTEKEIRHLYQVRLALEKLAIEEAITNIDAEQMAAIRQRLETMQQAIINRQQDYFTASDIEFHELIWQASGNEYLAKMLSSMIGPIFMFISVQTRFQENWEETLQLHAELVNCIETKDIPGAIKSITGQMQVSLNLALKAFQNT